MHKEIKLASETKCPGLDKHCADGAAAQGPECSRSPPKHSVICIECLACV
jgi:hypothetical protein